LLHSFVVCCYIHLRCVVVVCYSVCVFVLYCYTLLNFVIYALLVTLIVDALRYCSLPFALFVTFCCCSLRVTLIRLLRTLPRICLLFTRVVAFTCVTLFTFVAIVVTLHLRLLFRFTAFPVPHFVTTVFVVYVVGYITFHAFTVLRFPFCYVRAFSCVSLFICLCLRLRFCSFYVVTGLHCCHPFRLLRLHVYVLFVTVRYPYDFTSFVAFAVSG